MRYVEYFEQVFRRVVRSPALKCPDKIVVYTIPDVSGSGKCKPYLEIVNGNDYSLIWDNKESMHLKSYQIFDAARPLAPAGQKSIVQRMTLEINQKIKLSSDVCFRVKHRGSFKNKLICRFALNPAFIEGK